MIRVLFVTKHLRVGGAQRNWTILLPALAERGLDTRLVTLEDEGELYEELRETGIPVACAHMRRRLDTRAAAPVLAVASWRPDVVVSHDERSHLVARLVARRARAPHAASDHGGPGFRLEPHRELILRAVAPGFAAAVTMSERRVPDLLRRGFRRDRVHVIPNGVGVLAPSLPREAVRAELGLGADAFVALLVAVLRPEKRADRFVRAIARANERDPRVRGLVAGYGPEEARTRALARERGATTVLGDRRDVPDLVAAADAVCLTSDLEGAPYAALEAMALGKPVVAMQAGSLDEVVVDGGTGVLVPPGDEEALAQALVGLAGDPARAQRLGAAGRARQREQFGAARMADDYADLFRALAAARSSTAARAGAAAARE